MSQRVTIEQLADWLKARDRRQAEPVRLAARRG